MNEKLNRINAFLNAIEEKDGINDVLSFGVKTGGVNPDKPITQNSECTNTELSNCDNSINTACTNAYVCWGSSNGKCQTLYPGPANGSCEA